MNKRKALGLTIIELLIVMVVIGILTAIAFPAYTSHTRKGRRAQVQAFMMDMAAREQQYFTDMRSYAVDVGATKAYTTLNVSPSSDITSYYTIATSARASAAATTPSFTITATAINDQANDKQGGVTIKKLTIDDTGAKTVIDANGNTQTSVAW